MVLFIIIYFLLLLCVATISTERKYNINKKREKIIMHYVSFCFLCRFKNEESFENVEWQVMHDFRFVLVTERHIEHK